MLRVRSREVDVDGVARDRHGGADRQLAISRLEHVGSLVPAVGEALERGADDALRVGVELVHRFGNRRAPAVRLDHAGLEQIQS